MIDRATNAEYLLHTTCRTLKERVVDLKRAFTEKKFSMYYLQRLYKEHGITYKKIKLGKQPPAHLSEKNDDMIAACKTNLIRMKDLNYDIVWLDEVCFSSRVNATHSFSPKNKPLFMDSKKTEIKFQAVLAAVSEQNGIDMIMQFEKSVDQIKYMKFLVAFRQKYPFRKICFYLDNLSVHKTKKVLKKYDEL